MENKFSNSRDRHLFGPGRKRALALGGSGLRAVVSLAFLERIEVVLSKQAKRAVRLGDEFDLVGGASTAGLTAALIALGFEASKLKDALLKLAKASAKSSYWRLPLLQARYDSAGLRKAIEEIVGNRSLSSSDLITGLCIILKRMDTGSPWIISNNPSAPYWKSSRPGDIGTEDYPLLNLLRASTASPHFFDPELLPVSRNETQLPEAVAKPLTISPARAVYALLERLGLRHPGKIDSINYGLFIDGSVSPHANPSLALFNMVTLEPYHIRWPASPSQLTVCSIGSGRSRYQPPAGNAIARNAILALHSLISLMRDAEDSVICQMQYLGECPTSWPIAGTGLSEQDSPLGGKVCRFMHYDIELEKDWIKEHLGETISDKQLDRLNKMDDLTVVDDLYALARIAAERQIKIEHFQ